MKSLKVYIDYKSPYAFIAKDPTYALEDEFDIEIDWYPLTLNIKSYLGSAKKSDSGKVTENKRSPRQWLAVKYAYMDARRYANLRGLTLKGTQKIWDTALSGIGILWAKQQGRDILKKYTDLSYERFWRRDLDVEDEQVIMALLTEAGAATLGFLDYLHGEGQVLHDALQEEILDAGYYGVPTYVIDGISYFGREHLPRVRWHLGGCIGDLPDIANDTVLAAAIAGQEAAALAADDIQIYVDFNNLGTYVGLENILKLVDETGISPSWLPVSGILNRLSNKESNKVSSDPSDDPLAQYKARRLKARQNFESEELLRNCDSLGISEANGRRQIDSAMAHIGLLYVNLCGLDARQYIEALFKMVYRNVADVETAQVIQDLLTGIGAPEGGFLAYLDQGQLDWEQHQSGLIDKGIFDSPAIVIDGERFQGRQHLPLVRWHLTGRVGPAPV